MRVPLIRRNALFWTALSLALLAVAMVIAVDVFALSDAGHACQHLGVGIAVVLLAVSTMRRWTPRGSRMAGVARAVLVDVGVLLTLLSTGPRLLRPLIKPIT